MFDSVTGPLEPQRAAELLSKLQALQEELQAHPSGKSKGVSLEYDASLWEVIAYRPALGSAKSRIQFFPFASYKNLEKLMESIRERIVSDNAGGSFLCEGDFQYIQFNPSLVKWSNSVEKLTNEWCDSEQKKIQVTSLKDWLQPSLRLIPFRYGIFLGVNHLKLSKKGAKSIRRELSEKYAKKKVYSKQEAEEIKNDACEANNMTLNELWKELGVKPLDEDDFVEKCRARLLKNKDIYIEDHLTNTEVTVLKIKYEVWLRSDFENDDELFGAVKAHRGMKLLA